MDDRAETKERLESSLSPFAHRRERSGLPYDGEVAALQRLLDEGLISSAQRECGRTRVPPDELHTRHAGAELHQGVV